MPIEPPTPAELARDAQEFNAEIAFTVTFIWATAVLRFVIACRRHESLTASDPVYAAVLVFGIAGGVLGYGAVTAWRCAAKRLASVRAAFAT